MTTIGALAKAVRGVWDYLLTAELPVTGGTRPAMGPPSIWLLAVSSSIRPELKLRVGGFYHDAFEWGYQAWEEFGMDIDNAVLLFYMVGVRFEPEIPPNLQVLPTDWRRRYGL